MLNQLFAAFLHALPYGLGATFMVFMAIGFWRGLSLRPLDPDERVPDPKSVSDYCRGPWGPPPRWARRLFGRD